jgi:hypothetical protein
MNGVTTPALGLHHFRFGTCKHQALDFCYTYNEGRSELCADHKQVMSLIRKKRDTTQFLWVTDGPTYKLTTGKLSVQYALFTYVSV